MSDYMTVEQLVERYQGEVTPKTLANWRSEGRGPVFVKIGGKVLYDLSDVEAWERSRRQASGDQPEATR